jgi:AcrR family transcriptional regulator
MSSSRIADALRARIQSGELKAGKRVPSARQIMRKWGVANATASKALAMLASEGLVRAIPGVGTVVEQGLSQARIVATGIAIADREGLGAVTMRRIASELHASPMALYRHVADKEELVLLLADGAFAEQAAPALAARAGMRLQLEAAARCQWEVYRKHPWLAGVISITRPQLLPHGMLHTERTLRALDGHGLSDEMLLIAAVTIMTYVRGVAVNLESESNAQLETGLSIGAYLDRQDGPFRAIAASGQLPTLMRVSAQPNQNFALETLFEFGLARMLDGLSAYLHDAPGTK